MSHLGLTAAPAFGCLTIALLAAACGGDATGPKPSPPVVGVAVSGVRLDPATFRGAGTFSMGVVPTGTDGHVLLGDGVQIGATLRGVAPGTTIELVSREAKPAGARPIAAALNIDNSGSTASSDPTYLRRAASRSFWTAVLGAGASNQVALADFGHGGTSGFANTRLLEAWGRDTARLGQRLASMTPNGTTPLYESALELLQWVDTTRARAAYERVMVLMTDGQPNGDARRDSAAVLAAARGITVHTVGLGDASDLDPRRNDAAVLRVRELAYRTGGVYAAATSAIALDTVFRTIATVSSAGQILATFRVRPVPASGTVVSGTVTVTSGATTREAVWSLVAP